MLFGAAYYPEHRDPAKWDFDLDMMAQARVNALRVGEFAWVRFEPRQGEYDFEWMDTFAAKAADRGIGLLMCPPLRTAPAWLIEKDPSILIVNDQGVRQQFGSRYTFCINHPLLREKGLLLAETMSRHYAALPNLLGWHLDNEYGDEADCHCPICAQLWREYLRGRYGTIEQLNRAWGTVFWSLEFNDFAQVPTPSVTKTCHNPHLLAAWRQFRSDCTVEMIRLHAETVRTLSDKPVTTNYQALWNNRTDYYEAAKALDVCGTNYYPPYGDKCRRIDFTLAGCRSYKRKNFHVHELRSGPHCMAGAAGNTPAPGELARLTLHAVANGADAVFYFRWRSCPFGAEQNHGSVTDYDGRAGRVYDEVRRIGQNLNRLGGLLDGTQVVSRAAVLYDFPTRWIMESGSIWEGPARIYMDQTKMLYQAVRSLGVSCDAVGRGQNFSQYKLLLVGGLAGIDDDLARKLSDFVSSGGTIVWSPMAGQRDRDGVVFAGRHHEQLQNLLGARLIDFATSDEQKDHSFQWQRRQYAGGLMFELPEPVTASVQGEYANSWFVGKPAVLENAVGRGRAIYVTTFAESAFYRDLLAMLTEQLGIERILACDIPPEVEVAERRGRDGGRIVFILNCSGSEQKLTIPRGMTDVWAQKAVGGQTKLPPYGVMVLSDRERE